MNWDCKSATWSDYRCHITVWFLVCVFPNSLITLLKLYTRSSYKTIILQCCFLDVLLKHSNIVAYKGFWWMCCQLCTSVTSGEGCTSSSSRDSKMYTSGTMANVQRMPTEISKNGTIVNVRILMEEVKL